MEVVELPKPLKFKGTSEYDDVFVKHPLPEPQQHDEAAPIQSLPFDAKTGYQEDYINHILPRCEWENVQLQIPDLKDSTEHQYFVKEKGQWIAVR